VIEAVVFDLDGVLLDSEEIWDRAREQLVRERGGRWHAGAQQDMMGMSSLEWSPYMAEQLRVPGTPEEIHSAIVERLLERYGAGVLPSSAFGEDPAALRVRVATGLPYGETSAQREEAKWRTNYFAMNRRLARRTNAERFRRYGRKRSLTRSANQTGLPRETKRFASQRSVEGVLRAAKFPRKLWKNSWHQLLFKATIHRP